MRSSPVHTASISRNRIAGQPSPTITTSPSTVSVALSGPSNSRWRSQPTARRTTTGGGSGSVIARRTYDNGAVIRHQRSAIRIRALYQFISALVASDSAEIDRHGDGDDLDRLAGLVERRAGEHGEQVRIADGHRQRRILGQVEILVGQRRDDHPQRLRHHDQPQHQAAPQAERVGRLGLPARDRQDAGAHDLGDERRRVGRQRRSAAPRTPAATACRRRS